MSGTPIITIIAQSCRPPALWESLNPISLTVLHVKDSLVVVIILRNDAALIKLSIVYSLAGSLTVLQVNQFAYYTYLILPFHCHKPLLSCKGRKSLTVQRIKEPIFNVTDTRTYIARNLYSYI